MLAYYKLQLLRVAVVHVYLSVEQVGPHAMSWYVMVRHGMQFGVQ